MLEYKSMKLKSSRINFKTLTLLGFEYSKKDGSYFQNCPRDETGHCLKQDESDRHAQKDDKPKEGKPKADEEQETPKKKGDEEGKEDSSNNPDEQAKQMTAEPKTKATPGYNPDVLKTGEDGVTKAARCGVPGMSVPPPPARLPRLPNLTPDERKVEEDFCKRYEEQPQEMVDEYMKRKNQVVGNKDGNPVYAIGDAPNIFATDDAKMLDPNWNPAKGALSDDEIKHNRGVYNLALHQASNAIAKKAFLQYLDKLPDDKKSVLVTAGGCGAGKGFALGNIKQVGDIQKAVGAVWDSAGDQNSTELPWIQQECDKRGIKCTYAYIHADPKSSWADPNKGVVSRAKKVGRMVDGHVFVDSYALGAKNFSEFHKSTGDKADFFYINNAGGPEAPKNEKGWSMPYQTDKMPEDALSLNREELSKFAAKTVLDCGDCSPGIKRGATVGERIWGPLKHDSGKSLGNYQHKSLRKRIKSMGNPSSDHSEISKLLLQNLKSNSGNPGAFYDDEWERSNMAPNKEKPTVKAPPLNSNGTLKSQGH